MYSDETYPNSTPLPCLACTICHPSARASSDAESSVVLWLLLFSFPRQEASIDLKAKVSCGTYNYRNLVYCVGKPAEHRLALRHSHVWNILHRLLPQDLQEQQIPRQKRKYIVINASFFLSLCPYFSFLSHFLSLFLVTSSFHSFLFFPYFHPFLFYSFSLLMWSSKSWLS